MPSIDKTNTNPDQPEQCEKLPRQCACCKPCGCSEPRKSNDPNNSEEPYDIIRSPLDLRVYKSIVLPNGLRAMLISTYDIESYPEELDATQTPCQVPEVAEFNKTYLGYDNPAARVKCACPCDEKKPCCKRGPNEEDAPKTRKSILKELESFKAACCTKDEGPSEEKRVSFDATLNEFRKEVTRSSKSGDIEAYRDTLINELQKRAQLKMGATSDKKNLRNKKLNQDKNRTSRKRQSQPFSESKIFSEMYKINSSEDEGSTTLIRNMPTALSEEDNILKQKASSLRHYPNPPSYSEGLDSFHPCPIGTSGRKSQRPQVSSQLNSDFDGTAYLVIGSGYFDDPDDQPGLAHFCEHAVFLGSAKFPEPNQLFKLVLPYEGYVNAYTSGMMTTFTTSTSFRLFPLAVEILGDMIGFPLFPNALVAAELEALDSEYSLRQDDTPKYFQLIASLAKNGHVMRKMDSGNISTLTVPNFYRKLIEWRRIYYNPSRMPLALEAPFPIDFLERLVMESFGKIPMAATLPAIINRHLMFSSPFDMSRFHQIYHVPSVYHSEFIALHWALDAKAWKNLKTKPLEYLGAIIGHRAEGGLFHYLSSEGLATNVEAGCWESDVCRNHYASVFSISVDVTDRGFKMQDQILQAIFAYIQMLINTGPQKSFFQELQKQQLDTFHFKAAESNLCIADNVSRWMQFIPPKWCLISPNLTPEFDEKIIRKYTESLKIETANVIIFSKNYRGTEYMSNTEEFYNTPYNAHNFPEDFDETMRRAKIELAPKFSIPPTNPLLLATTCSRAQSKDLLQKGVIAKTKGKFMVSYVSRRVRLVRGLTAQARYSFWIGSPCSSYVGAPEASSTKMLIWSKFFNEIFETKFYHASNADLQLETEISQGELHITIAGPYTMLPPLIEQVLELFNDFENVVDPVAFDVVRSSFIESIDNTILDNRFLAWDLLYFLWTNNHYLIFDHRRNAERLTFTNFIAFVKAFKSRMYIQAHLYGYVTKVQGKVVVDALAKLAYSPIEIRQYLLFRCLRHPLGERVIRVNSQNPNTHTSVVINSYQFGLLTEAEEEVVSFFAKSMSDAAFYKLRTEQQLGYIIIIYAEVTFGVSSIVIELVTQPKNFTTDYCNDCIDNFLKEFYEENLGSLEAFQEFSLGKPKLELPFPVIQHIFTAYLLPNILTYRKLSIQVVGSIQDAPNSTAKSPPKTEPTTKFSNAKKNSKQPVSAREEAEGNSKVRKTRSLAAKATITNVKAVRQSLKVRDDPILIDKGRTGSLLAGCRVVNDVCKFKNGLVYYPKTG